MSHRKTICVDFDGVIHRYDSGWKGATTIPDPPVAGAFDWLKALALDNRFEVCVYSSRSKEEGAIYAMKTWMLEQGFDRDAITHLQFPTQKPAAWMTIDDRAFCFEGDFPSVEWLLRFRPWTNRGVKIE
jgi:hypothetical protein